VSNNEPGDASIRGLVKSVATDAQRLMKSQAELATTELKATQGEAATTGGMFAGAAVMGALGGFFLLVTIAYVLVALGLPTWAGFGIVTLVLFIVALILGLVGRSHAKRIKGPERAKLEWERTREALSGKQPENLPLPRATEAVAGITGDTRPSQR
jgi:Flp pilus assembly protein TadB